ncbi:hypothetical protein BU15DRAFT_78473 [Melanogaster broomeanus]|nr:hypothetical protein BU15DRAFT_78473 [Melanogaster broomeanus]
MSSYDQNLLDEAPKATRAQLQEGYNADLLDAKPTRSSSGPAPPAPTPAPTAVPLTPGIAETGSREKLGSAAYAPAARQSFWRTRNGILTIVLIAIVVIGAVVGWSSGWDCWEEEQHPSFDFEFDFGRLNWSLSDFTRGVAAHRQFDGNRHSWSRYWRYWSRKWHGAFLYDTDPNLYSRGLSRASHRSGYYK